MSRTKIYSALILSALLATITVAPAEAAKKSNDLSLFDNSVKSVLAYIKKSDYVLPKSEILFSPSVSDKSKKLNLEALSDISKLWSDFYTPARYAALLYSDNDLAWVKSNNYIAPRMTANDLLQTGWDDGSGDCEWGNAGNEWSQMACIGDKNYSWIKDSQLVAHEYTHNVQWSVGGNEYGGVTNYDRMFEIPSWLREGAATYYGFVIASKKAKKPSNVILIQTGPLVCGYFHSNKVQMSKPILKKQNFISQMNNVELGTSDSAKQYVYGSLATMLLVAKYGGHDAMMNFYENVRSGDNWETAFKNAFGLSSDSFYSKSWSDFKKFKDVLTCN